jgi:hypothetical protein
MCGDFCVRSGVRRTERVEQFFGLTLELIEIGMLAHDASRDRFLHNELLS